MRSSSYPNPTPPPSLGGSVEEVLISWRQATEACSDTARVRALLTLDGTTFPSGMFCWQNGQIQRLVSTDSVQPASRSDLEVLDACIQHGYILIYQQIGPGCQPLILHGRAILPCRQGSYSLQDEENRAPIPQSLAEPQENEHEQHALRLPVMSISARPINVPRRWRQWGMAIIYVVAAPCGGFIRLQLTRNPLMGWGSFVFLRALLWGGHVAAVHYRLRQSRHNVFT